MTLKKYIQKRNFDETPEPKGRGKSNGSKLSFVVQRHDASHLHYDFRLEMDGVLKSWAIPKGPSLFPGDKRLAVMVEDHPIKYGSFTGEIPEGNYGAGTVEIWDKGTYEPEKETDNAEKELLKELSAGSLKFILHGEQLQGSFALVALKNSDKNWLLIKHKDEFAVDSKYEIERHQSLSVSKKKLKPDSETPARASAAKPIKSVRSSGNKKFTDFIKPMLATLHDKPFDDNDWVFEIKWDGYRAVAELDKKAVKLYSRNGLSFADLYPSVVEALEKLNLKAVIDGEIVVLDENGKPSFQDLQNHGGSNKPLVFYVFDCLAHNGKDITSKTLLERKEILRKLIPANHDIIRYADHVSADGIAFFGKTVDLGLEGMIAKRSDGKYLEGKRSHDWLKIKNQNTQEAVIAGYTAPRGSRNHIGALVLGMYVKKKLTFIGHTGTGFTEKDLQSVYKKLQPLIQETSPFDQKIPMREKVTWLKPEQVCTVKFSEMTKEGILRHPVFMGLRIDKKASEVDHIDKPIAAKEKTKAVKKIKKTKQPSVKTSSKKKKESPGSETEENNVLQVDGKKINVSHQDKVYFPDAGITKGDVLKYYRQMAPYILPHLKDRPQSLKRNPNGITNHGFFQKDAAHAAPDWVKHIKLHSDGANKDIDYILCNDLPTLLYLNNLGCIEINPWNSRVKYLDNPDFMIMDIDPSDTSTFDEVIETAQIIHDILDKAGAPSYPKTSGATGMHIYIPLHAEYSYDHIRAFAEGIATLTVEQLPKTTTIERSLSSRKGRIYVDYLQNKRGQTLSSVYSLRPVAAATVSMPLSWKEVKAGLHPTDFTIHNAFDRVKKKGDIFAKVLTDSIDLEKCISKLGF